MDIIRRYLQAIEIWLPKAQRQDIIAEISEDIQSHIEEREAALGRNLTDSEIEEMLAARGTPLLVANRYLPQRYLIGPVLFPVYLLVARIYVSIGLPLWAIGYGVATHLEHPEMNWGAVVGTVLGSLWSVAFLAFGAITGAFALLQRAQGQNQLLGGVRKRTVGKDRKGISRVSSAVDFAINLIIATWWCFFGWSPVVFGLRIETQPVWRWFFWGFLIVMVAQAILAVRSFLQPNWTTARAVIRLVVDLAGGVLFTAALKADVIANVQGVGLSAAAGAHIRDWLQWCMDLIFPYSILVTAIVLLVDGYRIFSITRTPDVPKPAAFANPGVL